VTDSPPDNLQSLPETIEALRALVLATFAERDAVATERDTLLTQNDRLRHLLLKLTRMHFGARSERLPEEQLQLGKAGQRFRRRSRWNGQTRAGGARAGDRQRRGAGGEAGPRATQGQCGQAAREPWRAAGAPATGRSDAGARGYRLPLLPGG
jgi:hypothetical protein